MKTKILKKRTLSYFLIMIFICVSIILFFDFSANGFLRSFLYQMFVMYDDYGFSVNWTNVRITQIVIFAFIIPLICISFYIFHQSRMQREKENLAKEVTKHLLDTIHNQDSPLENDLFMEVDIALKELKLNELKKEQLYESELQKSKDLITYLAHDLKTPLASVIGYLSLLDEVKDMPEKQREKYTGISLEKAYRLETLINEFFEITRFNLQTILLNKQQLHISLMLQQLLDEFYPILQNNHKEVSLDVQDNLTIHADPNKLGRVLNNVFKNAISYSYEHTMISISVLQKDQMIVFKIENDGDTIPKFKLDMIFEKFYRLDQARSSNNGGAGLGLAIAKEIVLAHQGSIHVESDKNHTTFLIELPMLAQT